MIISIYLIMFPNSSESVLIIGIESHKFLGAGLIIILFYQLGQILLESLDNLYEHIYSKIKRQNNDAFP